MTTKQANLWHVYALRVRVQSGRLHGVAGEGAVLTMPLPTPPRVRTRTVREPDHSPVWLDWSAKTILALAAFGLWELLVAIAGWFVER